MGPPPPSSSRSPPLPPYKTNATTSFSPRSQKARTTTTKLTSPTTPPHSSSSSSQALSTPQETKDGLVSVDRSWASIGDTSTIRQHGEVPVLRAGAHQQGRLDQGGGPAPHRIHQGPWRGLLEIAAQSRRAAAVREELPAAVDQLPAAGPQARQLHGGGGRAHHQVPRAVRKQVVADRREAAGPDGQRDQELLEHAHQAQAPRPRHRPADAPPTQCQRRRRRRPDATAALPAAGAKAAVRCVSRPSPAAARSPRRRRPLPLAGGVQPQQRRRAPVRHSAATAPRHRPQSLHQPRAVPAAGGVRCLQQAVEARTGDDDNSRQHQCDAGVLVPQQPRVPAGR